jgi:hypothetical protein
MRRSTKPSWRSTAAPATHQQVRQAQSLLSDGASLGLDVDQLGSCGIALAGHKNWHWVVRQEQQTPAG